MLKLFDIQTFMINAIKNDEDFNDFIYEKIGKDMNYFIDPYYLDEIEDLPSTLAYGLEATSDKKESIYVVQLVIAVLTNERAEIVDGVSIYGIKSLLEDIGDKALSLIKDGLKIGVKGNCNISILSMMKRITPVGEAQDTQLILTLQLLETKFI